MHTAIINGIPLSAYIITYDESSPAAALVAKRLRDKIAHLCGIALDIFTVSEAKRTKGFIKVGHEKHVENTYGNANLYTRDGSVFIDGNDIWGLTACASYFISMLERSSNISDILYNTSLQPRVEYENNAEAFLPAYRFSHSVPDERLTLAEKTKALNDPKGRPFVIAHRCEHVFYPENSLEGALSAWRCGADACEIDIQKSKDGVWMCMHDADVTRTTNASEFINLDGFPDSPLLRDWTYEQLRRLRLKDAYGQLTPFVIPTLEEILRACDGRIYVHIDKRFSVKEDIFPKMDELGVYKCVYFITNVNFNDVLALKDNFSDKGVRLDSLPRPAKGQSAEALAEEIVKALPDTTPAIIPLGDYVKHGENEKKLIENYGNRLRVGAWFLRDFDTDELWLRARSEGISIFMTNRPMDMISLLTK